MTITPDAFSNSTAACASERVVSAKKKRQPSGCLSFICATDGIRLPAHTEPDAVAGLVEVVVGTADDVLLCLHVQRRPVGDLVTPANLGIQGIVGEIFKRLAEIDRKSFG